MKMTIETLRKISDKIPGEYDVIFETPKNTVYDVGDKIEVDLEHQRLILKK